MIVIGLTGVAGAGKSTVANYLVEQHGFTRLSFAAPLKKMLRTLNPIIASGFRLSDILEACGGDENYIKTNSLYGPEYRRLLQVLGTDCIRAVDEDFWVNAAAAQMDDQDQNYVFDDCRFPNEAFIIQNCSPEGLWNISRPGFEPVNGHISEAHAGKLGETVFLRNDKTVEMLHTDIDAALALVNLEEAA
jgi:hypothetical protein